MTGAVDQHSRRDTQGLAQGGDEDAPVPRVFFRTPSVIAEGANPMGVVHAVKCPPLAWPHIAGRSGDFSQRRMIAGMETTPSVTTHAPFERLCRLSSNFSAPSYRGGHTRFFRRWESCMARNDAYGSGKLTTGVASVITAAARPSRA